MGKNPQTDRPEPGENPEAWADAVYDAVQARLADAEQQDQDDKED